MFIYMQRLVIAALLLACGDVDAGNRLTPGRQALIGIDHMPTIVADLSQASASYRRMGFSLKSGRLHDNGLRNNHVKFKDGSGIELISVPAVPNDEMTRSYAKFLREGEGPTHLAFHARAPNALLAALEAASIPFEDDNGVITLGDPRLDFVFFVRDNRSRTDRPEHFAHSNGAIAMTEVWLALDTRTLNRATKLLLALGAIERTEKVMAPMRVSAQVFYLQNGRVVVVPEKHQIISGREIIGAKFQVEQRQSKQEKANPAVLTVEPSIAHGLWLRFAGKP